MFEAESLDRPENRIHSGLVLDLYHYCCPTLLKRNVPCD